MAHCGDVFRIQTIFKIHGSLQFAQVQPLKLVKNKTVIGCSYLVTALVKRYLFFRGSFRVLVPSSLLDNLTVRKNNYVTILRVFDGGDYITLACQLFEQDGIKQDRNASSVRKDHHGETGCPRSNFRIQAGMRMC
jgi:hypothetical protein